jgi:ABC-2 type transport system permease protein
MNLLVTPMREIEYVAGVALFGMVKVAIGLSVVGLGAALAFAFNVTNLGWGLVPIAAVLLLTGWVIAMFVIGLVLRFGPGAEALAWGILFAVLPLSGVFYPVSALPLALRPISLALPTTHAFAVARGLVDGNPLDWSQLGVAFVSAVVGLVVAVAFVTHMLAVFRRRGFVTRYS